MTDTDGGSRAIVRIKCRDCQTPMKFMRTAIQEDGEDLVIDMCGVNQTGKALKRN